MKKDRVQEAFREVEAALAALRRALAEVRKVPQGGRPRGLYPVLTLAEAQVADARDFARRCLDGTKEV